MSALLQNYFSLSNLSCNVDKGNGGSLVEVVAGWQCQRWWWQWRRHGGSGGVGSLVVTWRWTQLALGQRRQHSSGGSNISAARQQHGSMMVATREQGITRYVITRLMMKQS
jgi:hypothetical protein